MIGRRSSVLGTVAVLTFAGAAPAQDKVLATFKQGQITFTQGGKEGSVKLLQGKLAETPAEPGGLFIGLQYTERNKPANFELNLTRTKDNQINLGMLTLHDGPAGTTYFGYAASHCTVRLSRADAAGVEGSGTCDGKFSGPAITQFTFTARP